MIAHLGRADRPTRGWALVLSVAPDIDALSLLGGADCYRTYHHVLAHNLLFGAVLTLWSVRWVGWRAWPLAVIYASFLAHLVGDYFGSGPGWAIYPFEPFSRRMLLCDFAWELNAWPNILITVAAGAVAIAIGVNSGRTPLEFVHADLERAAVDYLQLARERLACHECQARAKQRCFACRAPLCASHTRRPSGVRFLCAGCAAG